MQLHRIQTHTVRKIIYAGLAAIANMKNAYRKKQIERERVFGSNLNLLCSLFNVYQHTNQPIPIVQWKFVIFQATAQEEFYRCECAQSLNRENTDAN